jgi:hypothetical protein
MITHARPRAPRRTVRALALATVAGIVAALLGAAVVSPAAAADGATVRVTDPGFSTTGTWSPSAVLGPDGEASRYTTASGATATWRLTAPTAGVYRVEAAIPDTASSDSLASYTASGGRGAAVSVVVDQTTTRGTWAPIGLVDLAAGEGATLTLARTGSGGGANTRAASARLVPDSGTVEPVETGLPFSDAHEDGLADWVRMGTSDLGVWSPGATVFDYLKVANTEAASGSYIRPTAAIELPEQYRLQLSMNVESTAGTVSLLTDLLSPYSATANNTAIQFTPSGLRIAQPNSVRTICSGATPAKFGEWFQLEVVRAAGVIAVYINSELVASVEAGTAGGTIGFGAYK